ncbi:dodecin family protein [Salinarchaeum laminariae]|uniref:dodecin family protein n=1 Tax=Salinarchaeum laminariae TaxID=869888 RepID=UPI0020BF9C34|nr:dodecin family protein [Salinarchaeum laminariae]
MTTVKIVKVLGTSEESWDHAAEEAVRTASHTIEGISGVEVEDRTATVEDGEIVEFKTTLEVAFPVQEQ